MSVGRWRSRNIQFHQSHFIEFRNPFIRTDTCVTAIKMDLEIFSRNATLIQRNGIRFLIRTQIPGAPPPPRRRNAAAVCCFFCFVHFCRASARSQSSRIVECRGDERVGVVGLIQLQNRHTHSCQHLMNSLRARKHTVRCRVIRSIFSPLFSSFFQLKLHKTLRFAESHELFLLSFAYFYRVGFECVAVECV